MVQIYKEEETMKEYYAFAGGLLLGIVITVAGGLFYADYYINSKLESLKKLENIKNVVPIEEHKDNLLDKIR